jgi:uncharacterized protein (DUF2267 family)
MMHTQETESWSGEGVGTSAESFLARINRELPEYPPSDAAEAVIRALCDRLPGGLVQEMKEQFPESLRAPFQHCWKERSVNGRKFDKDDFYLDVAEHLQIEAEQVRLVLHVVFAAIHSQITERLAVHIGREMPSNVLGTWDAARRGADLPR